MSKIRRILISDICDLNSFSEINLDAYGCIEYLDTGSIVRNAISMTQTLYPKFDEIPSRAKRKVKHDSIIYSTVRPNQEHFGYLNHPTENFMVSTGFTTLDVKDSSVDSKFLYYLLTQKHITSYLHKIGENSVSSYPSINPSDIGNLAFSIPKNRSEQQKIAAVLFALDAKIDCNNRINAELEAMAKTLYDYWFVQFDLLKKYNDIVFGYNQMIFIRSMENQQLTQLRDWLLPLLMNGQVTVA